MVNTIQKVGLTVVLVSLSVAASAGLDSQAVIANHVGAHLAQYSYTLFFLSIVLIGMLINHRYQTGKWLFSKNSVKSGSFTQKKISVDGDTSVIRVDRKQTVEFINARAQKYIGNSDDSLVGQKLDEALKQMGIAESDIKAIGQMVSKQFKIPQYGLNYEKVTSERNGKRQDIDLATIPVLNAKNRVVGVAITGRDQSEQRRLMYKLMGQAERDHLTGLVNRMGFDKFIEQFPENVRPGSKHVICYMDLDNFKHVNDSAGHAAGDELLKQVGSVFSKHVRTSDLLARIGGDEFAVLLVDCPKEKAKIRFDNMINSIASLRFSWGDKSFVIGVSMGAVEFDSGITAAGLHDLCKIADDACYTAKQKGRNQLFIQDPAEKIKSGEHVGGKDNWQMIIRDSLDNDKFKLFVQPILALGADDKDDKKRYEVYVRLPYNGRVLRPGSFFPSAERYGLSRSIDRWVIRRTMERVASLTRSNNSVEREFTINLSAASLLDEGFAGFVSDQLSKYGVSASSLCFEVSEASVISNFTQARKLLMKLADLGCSNSLDDFGSGLSALNYIRDLPIHYLKIDGVFVRNIETNQIDAAMIHSLNHMSKAMNLKTVAEFVEDEQTAKLLRRLGVNYAQGYYCGRPLPLERLEAAKAA